MDKNRKNFSIRARRSNRTRAKIYGTALIPRVAVFRSNKFISAQVINDEKMVTLVGVESKKITKGTKMNKTESAKATGLELGKLMIAKGIKTGIFDRRAYRYHGRVKALAEALREAGIKI